MTDLVTQALRPCPCGELPRHGYQGIVGDEEGYGFVECHRNGLSVVVHAATEAEALAAWNTRSDPRYEELLKLAEGMAEGLRTCDCECDSYHGVECGRCRYLAELYTFQRQKDTEHDDAS